MKIQSQSISLPHSAVIHQILIIQAKLSIINHFKGTLLFQSSYITSKSFRQHANTKLHFSKQKEPLCAAVIGEAVDTMLILLSPMTPHFCAELWISVHPNSSIDDQVWPEWDEEAAREDELTIVIQVQGKVSSRLQVPADIDDAGLEEMALKDASALKFIGGKTIRKVIVVKKKLVNIVI